MSTARLVYLFLLLTAMVIASSMVYEQRLLIWFASYDAAGNFGDAFGALNTVFSGIAAVGMVLALWLQSHELGLQRAQLQEQVQVLRVTSKQQEAQAQVVSEQLLLLAASAYLKRSKDIGWDEELERKVQTASNQILQNAISRLVRAEKEQMG